MGDVWVSRVGDWCGRSCISGSGVHDGAPFLQHRADQPQDKHLRDRGMLMTIKALCATSSLY